VKIAAILDRAAGVFRGRPGTGLTVLWLIAATPWLARMRTIPYDAKDDFYPSVVFTATSLLRGEAPWWNPYIYSGYPSFADPQAMTFSPSVVLPMLLSRDMVWFDIVILAHVLLGGIGILRLGRSYGWHDRSSLTAAIVFMFGGVAAGRLQHTPYIVTWSFLPWVFVAMRAVFAERSWRAVAGLGLALGLSALQLTQITYISLLVICAYGAYRWVGTVLTIGWRSGLATGGRLVVAGLVGLLIASPQVIATLLVLPHSNRGHFDLAAATESSLSAQAYLTLLSPNVLGNLSGPYVGPNDITETYLYLGAFPLVLLLAGLSGLRRGANRAETLFWASSLTFSVVYALGSATPAYGWLHRILPGMAYFKRPSDAAFLFVFSAALLIGASIDRHCAKSTDRIGRAPRVGALEVCVGLVFVAALSISLGYRAAPPLVSLAFLGVSLFCFARVRAGRRPDLWAAALLLAIFADVRIHNLPNRLNGHRVGEYLASASLEHNAALRLLARELHDGGYYRVELRTGVSELNAPEVMGIASIGGLNPLVLREYVAFVGMPAGALARSRSGAFDSYRSRINDLLGVRYLAALAALRPSIDNELGPAYRVIAELDGRVIWQNQNALPRVLRPRHAIPAPPLSAFSPATLDSIDLEEYAYVEAPTDVLAGCAGGRADAADIVRYSNNEVVVAVQADRAAWIVLNDVFFDAWRAESDRGAIPIYRANGIFRAVCVPPGQHAVRFEFHPFHRWWRRVWAPVGP